MEQLSDDTLEEIFQYLDQQSLISILLTCQRLQDFVICSGKMMNKLPVKLSAQNGSSSALQTVLTISEKMRDLQLFGNVNLDRFKHSCYSIRRLSLYFLTAPSYHQNQVKAILNTMSHLDSLSIFLPPLNVELSNDVILTTKLIKELKINYHHIKFLSGPIQSQKLTINFNNADATIVAPEDVISFIMHQTDLKSLTFTDLNLRNYALFNKDVSKLVQFKLEELKLIRCQINSHENVNHELFLKANTQLKRVTFTGSQISNIWKIVSETFLQLESVNINSSSIDPWGTQIPNLSVKKLQIEGYFDDSSCNATLQRFPAITELRQIGHIGFSGHQIRVISSTCIELSLLEIGILKIKQLPTSTVYAHLKTLMIDLVDFITGSEPENWNIFVNLFPVLECLIIQRATNSSQFPLEFLDFLLEKMPNLKRLELGGTLVELKTLQLIAKNPRSLKIFKFQKNAFFANLSELDHLMKNNKNIFFLVGDFDDTEKYCTMQIC